jgi:hypothetical protein
MEALTPGLRTAGVTVRGKGAGERFAGEAELAPDLPRGAHPLGAADFFVEGFALVTFFAVFADMGLTASPS